MAVKNKVVLITGCSTGIGRECARRLSESGYSVVATARRLETLSDLPVELKLELDVTNNASISDAIDNVVRKFGRIDVLINNAGFGLNSTIEDVSEDTLRGIYDVNVFGVIRMVKAVVPAMRKNKSGIIVNIGSIVGRFSTPVNGLYSSTKFAVEALSDSLRLEMASFGIKVILVEPGSIKSNFHENVTSRSKSSFGNANSIYRDLYDNFERFLSSSVDYARGPEAVSSVVQKAIETRKPRARYKANVPFFMNLIIGLPDGLRDFLFKIALKIKDHQ